MRLRRPIHSKASPSAPGFTLVEILVVVGVIAVLIALLLPALAGALRTSYMAKSQSSLKQIASYMALYSGENRETILPSQFDDSGSAAAGYPVKVRSDAALGALRYRGTWADILWTNYTLSPLAFDTTGPPTQLGMVYRFDSPDKVVYDTLTDYSDNPLRSSAPITRDMPPPSNGIPTPFGTGAHEASYDGYFAANNFFNTGPAPVAAGDPPQKWYTTGQIKAPERSMYLVDSLAGETIEPLPAPFDAGNLNANGIPTTLEVDFRYSGVCLMMYLDGHNKPEGPWKDLPELQTQRRIKVQNLDRN